MVVVVDEQNHPLGIITTADLAQRDQYTPARKLMSGGEVVTVLETASHKEAFHLMLKHHVKVCLSVFL